jgi:hypothetical protein
LLIEWNFILLSGDDEDFFGWSVFAMFFAFDGDIEDLESDSEAADEVAFISDGGVVLNCNQSR